MNEQWRGLTLTMKILFSGLFALMLFFAVGSLVTGRWATAAFSSFVVVVWLSLFGPLEHIRSATLGRLTTAQRVVALLTGLSATWLARFIASGDSSPFLGIGIVVAVGWLALELRTHGWSGPAE